MKKTLVFILLAGLVIACGSSTDNSSETQKPAVVDGYAIWKRRCVICHGLYGNQELNGAANLKVVDTPLEERIAIITNGKQGEQGIMQAFGGVLSPEQIEAVAKYTMTLNKDLQ